MLWVSGEVPDATRGGGSIRQAYLLRALAARAETHLIVAGSAPEGDLRDALASITQIDEPPAVPTMGGLSGSLRALRLAAIERRSQEVLDTAATAERLGAALDAAPARGDIVQVEHTGLAPLVSMRREPERWAITLHTIESRRAAQRAEASQSFRHRWLYGSEARRARRHEAAIASAYDRVWVMSDVDSAAFAGRSTVVPNGVDTDRYHPTPLAAGPEVVFTASLHYFPNIDGAGWFCREVLPLVRKRVPEVAVTIAGRRPVPEVERLADIESVQVLADVPDMVPVLAAARVAVVPLRVGSGTRLKALEAMAAGRPVVGTRVGLEGLGVTDGVNAVVADSADDFASGVVRVLQDDEFARSLAAAGRDHAERFAWDRIGADFADRLLAMGEDES